MIITLCFVNEQACLMAVDDFVKANKANNNSGEDPSKELRFKKRKNLFYLIIDSSVGDGDSVKKDFLEFLQNTPFYKGYYSTKVQYDTVRGFITDEAATDAVDLFNKVNPSLYLDPSEPLGEVATNKGTLYIPCIQDPTLETAFWKFVDGWDEVLENVTVGTEVQ